jgi:hypothetical protein
VLAPGRLPALLAGTALALTGILHVGFARVVLDVPWGGAVPWFRTTLALALPVTLLWVLASATLGRPRAAALTGRWRLYLLLQSLAAAASAIWLLLPAMAPPGDTLSTAPRGIVPLDAAARVALGLVVLNIAVYTVRFEASYVSLPRRHRRAFRPALGAIVIASAFYAAFAANGIWSERAVLRDLALGAGPVAVMALFVPLSYVRGRVGEARLASSSHPVTATTSFFLAAAFLAGAGALLWTMRAWGVSFGRGLGLVAIGAVILGVAALAISNRARRRTERALAPLWQDWRGAYRMLAARAASEIDTGSRSERASRIAPHAASLARLSPVTLFLLDEERSGYRPVSTTLDTIPEARVGVRDPLAIELRRARRPIRLLGSAHDLEYVSIYVENRAVLAACRARFAIPLIGEEEMVGFLLCGPHSAPRGVVRDSLRILHFISRHYAAAVEPTPRN